MERLNKRLTELERKEREVQLKLDRLDMDMKDSGKDNVSERKVALRELTDVKIRMRNLQKIKKKKVNGKGNHNPEETGVDATDIAADQDIDMEVPELEAIKARVRAMEEEIEKLRELQSEAIKARGRVMEEESEKLRELQSKIDVDSRSVFIGNVDYGATAKELEKHFHGCGSINRVTILCNKFDGYPKGFAYLEFTDKDSVQTAMAMDDSLFRGRQIKVMPKRTNMPAISTTYRPLHGRGGFRARGGRGLGFGGGYMKRPRGMGHYSSV